ncbi:UDP-N-acetylmuramoyl-L-alanyl-D-glutamate--2,6-diaminopimelate ligase [Phaeocystidibacter luteus]|uniref:UDP-N-acetylmuramoyl-L-alanyl-D-glutamate--2,6-diaminopimelate ligase n=1 Tax=Phaeocystidibacter luteus TaxID=911197 RepID=A0A6N6RJB4_9FLAO|nr:UDP-N-acetylmuramoyl-L-alanyl-D-glutamate--2,6-diaminopimelate ligase [Phaeocystidibacter luteus]KAB2813661.1 UDP-N-acetylmuramoyl-L-alanyl-D-glutamate--2,6-diaminopimelate ligase [Phaeocystidibacter luteus]
MKILKDILYKTGIVHVEGSTNVAIQNIVFDSRAVKKDSLFVAMRGTQVDGHKYIAKAIELGARAIICEETPENLKDGVTFVLVKNTAEALAQAASNFYDEPSKDLKLVGVTGTNGKTTTTTLMYDLCTALDKKAGLISTVRIKIGKHEIPATHTTPDPVTINRILRDMVDHGCKYAFMEVSSHGLHQKRVHALKFSGGVFTNITHDHLDYHKTFDDYILAKKILFDILPQDAFALVNIDDRHGDTMLHHTKAEKKSFALKKPSDYKARIMEQQLNGTLIRINEKEFWTKLIGDFNAYNMAAVFGVAMELGFDELQTLTALSTLNAVEGRFQYVRSPKGLIGIVDYAHTPDALKNVLETINGIRTGNETVYCLVGCGGDRDASKRPVMAKIATQLADKAILTSDNPRTEDPEAILRDMEKGVEAQNSGKRLTITDRREAIRTACSLASEGDIILVAGKGHEKYQDVNGVKHPFDDLAELNNAFTEFKK